MHMAEYTLEQKQFEDLVERAQMAFWQMVGDAHPEIKTGDFSPEQTIMFEEACAAAITGWLANNKPEPGLDSPTVYLRVDRAAFAFDTRGEMIEVEVMDDGAEINWHTGGVADGRGGHESYMTLYGALIQGEAAARAIGYDVKRIAVEA